MTRAVRFSLLAWALACASCARAPSGATDNEQAQYRPVASIQELMKSQVEPAAFFIWEAVSTTDTLEGTEEKRPRTAQDWLELRHRAITLVEVANLLLIPNRKVAADGTELEDAEVEGIWTAHEIQHAIDADRTAFAERAHRLNETATQVLAAIDAQDTQRLIRAGGDLDEACESCHATYWYPNTKVPAELAATSAN